MFLIPTLGYVARVGLVFAAGDRQGFISGGCSRRGVQWMGVVLYNKPAYNIM